MFKLEIDGNILATVPVPLNDEVAMANSSTTEEFGLTATPDW